MRPKRKSWTLFVPRPLPEVWDFFSRPENLNKLTPAHVSFHILSPLAGQEMYPGMIVQYQISPLLGIPMNWVTEITQIRHHEWFIDDQRVGPYALWHHQHHFKAVPGGTEMTDILHYQVPLGPLGTLANALFVERMVDQIFSYREAAVKELF
jgi:ligand-binding SRPBCC domain-containing protein